MHDIAKSMLHAWVEAAPHHALENAVKTFINPLFRRKYPEKQKNPLFQYVRRPIPTPPAERTLNPAYYKEAGLFVFGWDKRQYIRLRHASSEHPLKFFRRNDSDPNFARLCELRSRLFSRQHKICGT